MNFLPLVNLELVAGARRKSTYRIRFWFVVLAILICLCGGMFALAASGMRKSAGGPLFTFVTGYVYLLCLLAGVFLTSDCLSVEKREGTLGLLFLTDLNGFDVVLGKFMGRSLNAFYGLIGLLPVVAIPFLLGGVTGGEYWRTALALVNGLFLSLSAGMMISVFSRDERSAMGGTILLLGFLTIGLSLLRLPPPFIPRYAPFSWLNSINPIWSFWYAADTRYILAPSTYWSAVLFTHLLSWCFLLVASTAVPRVWQQRELGVVASRWLSFTLRKGSPTVSRRTRRNPRLLQQNPVLWLMADEGAFRLLVWLIVGAWGITVVLSGSTVFSNPNIAVSAYMICGFILKMLVAVQACRFFVDSRRNGALELLLTTPIQNREIIGGQWMAIRRIFFWPLVVFMALNIALALIYIGSTAASPSGGPGAAALRSFGSVAFLGWSALNLVLDILAIGWFGMWLALSVKNPSFALSWTILLVLVIPSIPFCGMGFVADIVFIIWGSDRLRTDIRYTLARQYSPRLSTLYPLARPRPNPPPPPPPVTTVYVRK